MRPDYIFSIFALGILANSALAEVTDVAANGFSLTHEVTINAARADVWVAAVDHVGQWWDGEHTIAGSAAALSIDAVPLGCFCEDLGDKGGVVHMTITFANANVILRLTGGLGPMGLMGVSGNMTWEFFDADAATRVRFSYVVGGYSPDGLDNIATPVDVVIGEALQRLKSYVETGSADMANGD